MTYTVIVKQAGVKVEEIDIEVDGLFPLVACNEADLIMRIRRGDDISREVTWSGYDLEARLA